MGMYNYLRPNDKGWRFDQCQWLSLAPFSEHEVMNSGCHVLSHRRRNRRMRIVTSTGRMRCGFLPTNTIEKERCRICPRHAFRSGAVLDQEVLSRRFCMVVLVREASDKALRILCRAQHVLTV